MSDIYKIAAQKGLRFPSNRGLLMVEQLFTIPLKSTSGFDLDTIAKGINNQLKEVSTESFVIEDNEKADPRKADLEVSLEIVKDVIKTRQAESEAQRVKANKAARRAKILDAMEEKENQALSTASREDLEKQLAELD